MQQCFETVVRSVLYSLKKFGYDDRLLMQFARFISCPLVDLHLLSSSLFKPDIMKWAFAIQRKIRLAIMLAVMMLFVILFSLLESYNINRITKSFNSIYEDRLIPAADLFAIADEIDNNRNKLFTFLFTDNVSPVEIGKYFQDSNRTLDSLISKYESTFLIKEETNYLQNLKKNLRIYQRDENILLSAAEIDKEAAKKLYLKTTVELHNDLEADLRQLIKVQTEVGRQLLAESEKSQASSTLITQLQLVITIILGLIIMILVVTGNQVKIRQENYKLN